MTRQSAIVIAPGRGTYGKPELGYLARHHGDKKDFFAAIDDFRRANGRTPILELDSAKNYAAARHASSENASALIYACALADFMDIDQSRFEIVAVTGNSLGWYLALAAAGALSPENAIRLVDSMGALMEEHGVGGQLVYPVTNADWQPDAARAETVKKALAAAKKTGAAFNSIHLGGMAILAGDEAGLAALEENLPPADERFPFRLARHAAFHTPLLAGVSQMAVDALPSSLFAKPSLPLVDGRGEIWQPAFCDIENLHNYTLTRQITETYNFTACVEIGLKEFAPDRLIILGPGTSMGPPVAQILIANRWHNMHSKADFIARQKQDPFVLAMGMEDQRKRVVKYPPIRQPVL